MINTISHIISNVYYVKVVSMGIIKDNNVVIVHNTAYLVLDLTIQIVNLAI